MKKKSITTCAILTYMAIVNIFSACALYSYYRSVKTKTVFTIGTMSNQNVTTHLLKQQNIYSNAMRVNEMNEMNAHLHDDNNADDIIVQLKPVSASCASRLLIYYHITEHPNHHTSRSLGVLQRIIKNSNAFVVLVVGVDLFENVYRDWCFRLKQYCQINILTRDIAEWTISIESEDQNDIMTISLQRLMRTALLSTPSMCVHGVVVLSSGFVADVGFSRRLQAVPKDKLGCLYSNAPPLCSAEALWVPYVLLKQASNTEIDIDIFARHERSNEQTALITSSVNVLVEHCIQRGLYSGSHSVVVQM